MQKNYHIFIFVFLFFSHSLYAEASEDKKLATILGVITNFILMDNTPKFISPSLITVSENQTSAITLVFRSATVVTYSISEGNSTRFDINETTGVVTFKTPPDYESASIYTFLATATDEDNNTATQEVRINISDIDEIAPNTPTLTASAPTETTLNSINVEINGEVGSIVYVNTVQVGVIAENGKVTILLSLVIGSNTFSITLKDAIGNESTALSVSVNKVVGVRDVMINELSSGIYTNSNRWFELYNPRNSPVNINEYTLKSTYYDGTTFGIFEFSLPSKTIPAGGYLVIRPNYASAFSRTLPIVENNEVLYLKDTASNKYPTWYSNTDGFLELLKNGVTVDFVTFGLTYTPTTPSAWTGGIVPTFGTDEWKSLARYKGENDTNTSTDWYVRDFPTYGGVNDVDCNTDSDADGIPDCSEVSGSTYAGMDLYAFGARINQKDMFIEVDYVDSTNGGNLAENAGVVPQQKALEKVRNVFTDNNYSVHFDVGDLFDQDASAINPSLMDLGGGNLIPYVAEVSLGCTNNGTDARDYKAMNMQTQRKQIFYYMFFGISQGEGISGCGELPGNDTIITLGEDNLNKTTEVNTNRLYTYQAGVVMHEFGHNLNLQHGGNDSVNNKPNYLSVMNYLYGTRGLATIGDNEGDRYYQFAGCTGHYTTLTNSPYESIDNFVINYSHGVAGGIDEGGGVVEANGLGYNASVPVDFDCDNNPNETLTSFDVNKDSSATLLTDHDDWALVNIIFARTDAGHASFSNENAGEVPQVTPTMDDRQAVVIETPMPKD